MLTRHAVVLFAVATLLSTAMTYAEKDLSESDDEERIIEIRLGETPRIGFAFWSGHGVVLAHVTIEGTSEPEKVRAKITHLTRLWKDSKSPSYEHRTSPQITEVPFDDENGNKWSLKDGNTWELGETFLITIPKLRKMAQEVPRYKPDGRPWYAKMGATNAAAATEAAIEVTKIAAEISKSNKD